MKTHRRARNPGEKSSDAPQRGLAAREVAAQTGTAMRRCQVPGVVGRHATRACAPDAAAFMNASGRPVQMIASFFKIAPADILVLHDELDFAPGVAKLKQGGGIAGHNGLRDISARIGSHDYWRLRIGVGHPGARDAVTEYVLNKPSADDRTEIDAAITRARSTSCRSSWKATCKTRCSNCTRRKTAEGAEENAGGQGSPGKSARGGKNPRSRRKPRRDGVRRARNTAPRGTAAATSRRTGGRRSGAKRRLEVDCSRSFCRTRNNRAVRGSRGRAACSSPLTADIMSLKCGIVGLPNVGKSTVQRLTKPASRRRTTLFAR